MKSKALRDKLSKHHFVVGTVPNVPYRDCEAQLEVGENSTQRSRSESLNLAGNKCIHKSCKDCLQSFSTLGLTVLISVL